MKTSATIEVIALQMRLALTRICLLEYSPHPEVPIVGDRVFRKLGTRTEPAYAVAGNLKRGHFPVSPFCFHESRFSTIIGKNRVG
jgi:hypothetical protein